MGPHHQTRLDSREHGAQFLYLNVWALISTVFVCRCRFWPKLDCRCLDLSITAFAAVRDLMGDAEVSSQIIIRASPRTHRFQYDHAHVF